MIASIEGTVATVGAQDAVINNAGFGFAVKVTPATAAQLRVGATATLYTSLVVREDSLTLYGFAAADERDLFELLQTASGVGPRLAQAALAVHQPDVVHNAIASGDTKTLTRIPGVGQKGAQRLVLELKDKVQATVVPEASTPKGPRPIAWREQVHQGLMALGWSAKESSAAVTQLDKDVDTESADVPALLKQAIRLLGKS